MTISTPSSPDTSAILLSSDVPPGDHGKWNERGYLADMAASG
jgi:hypothetical protein